MQVKCQDAWIAHIFLESYGYEDIVKAKQNL